MKNFVEELKWRGLLHDIMPGTEEQLAKEKTAAYIGFDPTADSLHIGSLVQIFILKHFQLCGHKPIALDWWCNWNGWRSFRKIGRTKFAR